MRECPVMDHVPATSGPAAGFRFRARRIGCSEAPQRGDQSDLCGYTFVDYRRPSRRATMSFVARGCSAVGSASPCQGEGRGFESRHPLEVQSHQPQRWSGRVVRQRPAKPCTRVRFPSPPPRWTRAISSAGERFPDTEEVTGSIPVSRTSIIAAQSMYLGWLYKSSRRPQDNRLAHGAH